jgi:hypothetical protein
MPNGSDSYREVPRLTILQRATRKRVSPQTKVHFGISRILEMPIFPHLLSPLIRRRVPVYADYESR